MSLPDKIGPYPVVRKLGEGGMGAVYEVRDPLLGRPLAVKVLLRAGDSSRALDRFWREAEALGKVQHPGIVRVHLTGRSPQGPYLVQELVEGEGLDRALEAGPLEPRRAAEVLRDLAEALTAVHERGLLHRDLKPANVIVRRDGRPVLIDFGLAWDAEAERLTRTGAPLGTPAYMPPEQARGTHSAELDARSDVYGLGAILYECVTGSPPFTADSALALFAQVLHQDPVWPADARPGVPQDLDAICRRAMAKAREDRYASARDLRDDLERYLRGEPLAAGSRASSVVGFTRAVRRRAVWVALLGLAALGAAGALWLVADRRAQERARVMSAARDDLEGLAGSLGPDASTRLLEQVERALAKADELMAASSSVADADERGRLAATSSAIRARRDRALFLRAASVLDRAPAAPDVAAIDTALDAAARVPPSSPPDAEVEEARGAALLLAGLAVEARDALARAAIGDPAGPARRGWLLAWAELAAGDARAAEARLAASPPLSRARLLAACAALAPDAPAADLRARALALLPVARDAEAALVAATLDVDALRRRPDAPSDERLDVLLAVRALSLPSSPGRVARAVQAEACLLEGAVLLELGWSLSAAEAFARHALLAGAEPAPSPLVPVAADGERVLAAPDLAARVGEARARARWLDEAAASAAREAATLRARRHPALSRTSLEAPPDARLTAEGWAELAVARAGSASARLLARRAFELALRAAPDGASAWAGLAQVEALAGASGPARAALEQARRLAPAAACTREAELDLLLAAGATAEVLAALDAALAALDGAPGRPLERTQRALALARRVHEALRRAGCDVDALGVLDRLSRRADADRLPPPLRRQAHQRLRDAASKLERLDLASAGRERLSAVEELERRLARARRQTERARRTSDGVSDRRGEAEIAALLAASPVEATLYLDHHNLGARLRAGGFDSLAIAFELDPPDAVTYLNRFGPRDVAPEAAGATRAAIAALAGPGEPDPTLPHVRDEALRAALGALYALDAQAPLAPATLRACHAAALEHFQRRPETLAAALLLGRLQVGIGDFAGALSTLARAGRLPLPIAPGAPTGARAWSLFYRALAHGGLRRWDDARRCLEELAGLPASERHAVRGRLVLDDPLLWEDRGLPGTIPGWARDLARGLER